MTKTVNWAEVKKNAIKNCTDCNSIRSYTNPFWKCFECKKKFCGDCINGGQINSKMSVNDEVRDICDNCKADNSYKNL